jgi:excisionase family DNA binding protein
MAVHDLAQHGSDPVVGAPQTWRNESLCRKYPTSWWFAGGHSETAQAKAICADCVVRAPCLEFALSRPDLLGIWAATTSTERTVLRRERRERGDVAADDAETEVAPPVAEPTVIDLVAEESVHEVARESEPEPEPLRGARRGPRVGWRETVLGDHADLLTPAEAARKLGVTPNTVTRWSRAGKIAAIQTMGGHRRFRRSEIERLLREANVAANQY